MTLSQLSGLVAGGFQYGRFVVRCTSIFRSVFIVFVSAIWLLGICRGQSYQRYVDFGQIQQDEKATSPGLPTQIVKGLDGNSYGISSNGGANAAGAFFRFSTSGSTTILASFPAVNGQSPQPNSLVAGTDGNFYGTTFTGGSNNTGSIFKIDQTGYLSTVYSFGTTGDENPSFIVQGLDGNFYGASGNDVFKYNVQAGTYSVIATMPNAVSSLIQAQDGSYYGTTYAGGANSGTTELADVLNGTGVSNIDMFSSGYGTFFHLSTSGNTLLTINFTGVSGSVAGASPTGLTQAADGKIWGITQGLGGTNGLADYEDIAHSIFAPVYRYQQFVLPQVFTFDPANGQITEINSSSVFYVDITYGYLVGDPIFIPEINYGSSTSGIPGRLIQAADGSFYLSVGPQPLNSGSIYKIDSSKTISLVATIPTSSTPVLPSIPGGSSYDPYGLGFLRLGLPSGLVQSVDGSLFCFSTSNSTNGGVTVFKTGDSGGPTIISNLSANQIIGSLPGSLIEGPDGSLYGICGTGEDIFKVDQLGNLSALGTAGDLVYPDASGDIFATRSLFLDASGNLFLNEVEQGGNIPRGTARYVQIYRPAASGTFRLISGQSNVGLGFGYSPDSTLAPPPTLNFFSGSSGVFGWSRYIDLSNGYIQFAPIELFANASVFQANAGSPTLLFAFTGTSGGTLGDAPTVIFNDPDGNIYGATGAGGASDDGTLFEYNLTTQTFQSLAQFTGTTGSTVGAGPTILFRASDGNFYGITSSGGTQNLGTVFQYNPTTAQFKSLVSFTGTTGAAIGSSPVMLMEANGYLYGNTSGGGGSGNGTVFRISLATKSFQSVVQFTGTGGARMGAAPTQLVLGNDGIIYGMTSAGGASGSGTVFEISKSSVFSSVYDLANLTNFDAGSLFISPDGNLYGTGTSSDAPGGFIFKVVLPGPPSFGSVTIPTLTATTAQISFPGNARGPATSITLSYGTDGVNFPTTVPITVSLSGYQTSLLGAVLSNLTSGTVYYYKITATNSAGTTTTSVASFTTLAPPTATARLASNLTASNGQASAQLNGTVTSFNFPTTVVFRYGTDGNTFPFEVKATQGTPPGTISSNSAVLVSATAPNLQQGTTYFYRVVATSQAGVAVSGTSTFTTLIPPIVTAADASLVGSQSAQLNGTVNAQGGTTAVTFEYGTDGVHFLYTVPGTPSPVTGNTGKAVSGTISASVSTPLVQGTTYFFRVRGHSAGVTDDAVSSSLTFNVQILSGFNRNFPAPPPDHTGSLLVMLTPAVGNSGWRFTGEQLWRASGATVGGLATGDYTIEYEPTPGYIQPPPETVSVTTGLQTTINQLYFPSAGGTPGGLNVILKPINLAGAHWRFYGESAWRNSGDTAPNLASGSYLIECQSVSGRTTPSISSIYIPAGQTPVLTLTYSIASTLPGAAVPQVLPFSTVTTDPSQATPYAFVGQLRSDVGSSTGFVVSDRVVATAGHVVFDDGSLSYVTGLQWLFQRYAGTYEPVPQTPHGSYIFDGYASQRISEGTPGVSSPASQNLDAASLYFLEFAGGPGGGFSGYLASNAATNEFLTSTQNKTLVGYPVDGIAAANLGQMFATTPLNVHFNQVVGTDTSSNPSTQGNPYQVYTTSDIISYGGNSGGPLCVLQNGAYYPAAIYLGGSAQTVVRAIDKAVVDLFNRAQVSGNGGGNNTGGGITQVNTALQGSDGSVASLKVHFTQPDVAASAQWALGSGINYPLLNDNSVAANLLPGTYTIYFTAPTAPGFITPSPQTVTLVGKTQKTVNITYDEVGGNNPPAITSPLTFSALAGITFIYPITASHSPDSFSAAPLPSTLKLNATTGVLTGSVKTATAATPLTIVLSAYRGGVSGPSSNLLLTVESVPTVTTGTASAIGTSGATLNATIVPKGSPTSAFIQYGTSMAYGSVTPAQDAGASASATFTLTGPVNGLLPGTKYHYRAVGVKAGGITNGVDKTFTTVAVPTLAASPQIFRSASGAEVSFAINPNGISPSITFQYGTTASYGSTTLAQTIKAGTSPVNIFSMFPDLEPNTIYHYRYVITTPTGTIVGVDQTFTTLSFDTSVVVKKGDAAVAIPSTYSTFGIPAVNALDGVAFYGTLAIATGVTSANNIGIWADDSLGARQMVARLGATAPNTSGVFATLSDPVYNDNSDLAFRGTLKVATGQATMTTATGVWASSSGSLQLVARQGGTAPGTSGATFNAFTSLGLSESAGAVIYATLNSGTGITSSNNSGVWEGNATGDLSLQLRLGQLVGGKTITKLPFMPLTLAYINGQTRAFNANGDLVSGVTLSNPSTKTTSTGIVKVVGGVASIAASSLDAAADISGATFASFGNPTINLNGGAAFMATLTASVGGVTSSTNTGIWADDGNAIRHLIARSGTGLAPGTLANFATFSDPVYNNSYAVAFRATLKAATGQATTSTATGIWASSGAPGSLALVARQGSQAPGCPAGATFNTFTGLALPDQGGAVIFGTLNTNATAGVISSNNTGIWAIDTSGQLQLIVRTGDLINIAPTGAPVYKTITQLTFLTSTAYVGGQSRNFAPANGDLVYRATFSDGSTAILNVAFP